jgi:hypothetical protein
MLKIRDDFPLEKLADYGYSNINNYGVAWSIECDLVDGSDRLYCKILIKQDRQVNIYFSNRFDEIFVDLDDLFAMPVVIFDMIKEGILVKK